MEKSRDGKYIMSESKELGFPDGSDGKEKCAWNAEDQGLTHSPIWHGRAEGKNGRDKASKISTG